MRRGGRRRLESSFIPFRNMLKKIVEYFTFHTKKTHSHGWEKDDPKKLNVN